MFCLVLFFYFKQNLRSISIKKYQIYINGGYILCTYNQYNIGNISGEDEQTGEGIVFITNMTLDSCLISEDYHEDCLNKQLLQLQKGNWNKQQL